MNSSITESRFVWAAARHAIEDEVPAPDVVGRRCPGSMATVGTHAQTTPISHIVPRFQALSLPEKNHAGHSRRPSFEDQQLADPPIAEPRPSASQLKHPLHQRCLVGPWLCLESLTAARLRGCPIALHALRSEASNVVRGSTTAARLRGGGLQVPFWSYFASGSGCRVPARQPTALVTGPRPREH